MKRKMVIINTEKHVVLQAAQREKKAARISTNIARNKIKDAVLNLARAKAMEGLNKASENWLISTDDIDKITPAMFQGQRGVVGEADYPYASDWDIVAYQPNPRQRSYMDAVNDLKDMEAGIPCRIPIEEDDEEGEEGVNGNSALARVKEERDAKLREVEKWTKDVFEAFGGPQIEDEGDRERFMLQVRRPYTPEGRRAASGSKRLISDSSALKTRFQRLETRHEGSKFATSGSKRATSR